MTRFRDAYTVRENYYCGVEFESSKEGYWVIIKMRKNRQRYLKTGIDFKSGGSYNMTCG